MSMVINVTEIPLVDINKSLSEQEFIFEKYQDENEGNFLCLKIDNFEQLEFLFRQVQSGEQECDGFIYRGQRDCNWVLESSFHRKFKDACINIGYHFENFRKLARGKLSEQSLLKKTHTPEYVNELWAVGQHLGLYTPLLDWSYSFYVALFFAFENKEGSDYRAVYRINESFFHYGEMYISECFIPYADPVGRISAQQGLFVTQNGIEKLEQEIYQNKQNESGDNQVSSHQYCKAMKFYISSKIRQEVLSYLKHIGITYDRVYPDLVGAVKKANADLDQCLKNNQRTQK